MDRVFENKTFFRRLNIYVVILAVVILNGCWEIWSALRAPDVNTTGLAFGALFIAGGLYGIYQTLVDGRDLVAAFDANVAAGTARVTFWRPFRRIQLDAPLAEVRNWRFWVKTGPASQRGYYLYADFPGYARKLLFELRRGQVASDGLRTIAPQAIRDFEDATGAGKETTAA